jgi:rhodanese-related sulfurtransferase
VSAGNGAAGIDQLLEEARAGLHRVLPSDVQSHVDSGAVLVDIRPAAQRAAHGEIAGAHVIERNVLEWRLDPTSSAAVPWASRDAEVIVLCQEGYASSLAAQSLQRLGISAATDLEGGFAAWKAAGLPCIEGPSAPVAPGGGPHGRA